MGWFGDLWQGVTDWWNNTASPFLFGGYQQVPGTEASDYQMIDPNGYTQNAYNMLTNEANWNKQQAAQYGGMSQNLINQALTYNPRSGMNMFLSYTPQLQNLVMGSTSPMEQMLRAQTSRFTREATADVANQFSSLGSLYSGAAMDVASRRAAEAGQNAAIQLGGQQLGLYGNLLNQAMGLTQRASELPAQYALQGAGLYGNMYGSNINAQANLLNAIANFGTPNYAAPQYEYQQGFVQQLIPTAAQVATAIALA